MTAYYKMPGFTLARANLSTKVLISAYAATVLVGLWVSFLQYESRAGTSNRGAQEWVLGNESDLDAVEFKSAKSTRELISITHEHIFSLPMLTFLLLHLTALCSVVGERTKVALYLTGFGSMASMLAGPWLISAESTHYALLMRVSGMLFFAVMTLACALTLYEMWVARWIWKRRGTQQPQPPEPMFEKLRQGQ